MLSFRLEGPAWAELSVYDASGRRVAILEQGLLDSGEHQVEWRGRDAAGRELFSGLYLARLDLGRSSLSRRLVLLK